MTSHYQLLSSLNLEPQKNPLPEKSLAFTLVIGLGVRVDRAGEWKWVTCHACKGQVWPLEGGRHGLVVPEERQLLDPHSCLRRQELGS